MAFSQFNQTINVDRFSAGGGHNAAGDYIESSKTPIQIQGSVQPTPANELKSLPEGRRNKESYTVFTKDQLFTVRESGNIKADRLTLFGRPFEIVSVSNWQNNVIPHFEAIAQLID